MIRIEGSTEHAEYLEEKIKKETIYLKIPFCSSKREGGNSGNPLEAARNFPTARKLDNETKSYTVTGINNSGCFTRDYEIIAAADKVKQVSSTSQRRIRDMLLWLTYAPIEITFRYDYRVNKCVVIISHDSWQRLVKIMPELKDCVKTIKPNVCVIVETA